MGTGATVTQTLSQTPALPPHGLRAISLRGMVLLVMLIFLLLAANNSPAFGGGWAPYIVPFEVYLLIFGVAVTLESIWAPIGTTGRRLRLSLPEEERPDFAVHFAFWFGVVLLAVVAVGGLALYYLGAPTAPLTGQDRITTIVYVLVFVAPTEEYLFRVVLPQRVGWVWGAVILFGIFHIGAYTATGGGFDYSTLSQLFLAMALGWFLWLLYDLKITNKKGQKVRLVGYGGVVAAHGAYDLLLYGAVGGFSLQLLSLIPFLPK
jgi:hypothetical protein